jgi:DeoR family transcriptional regulator of aga operon
LLPRYERWNALLDLVAASGHLSVVEAARALTVSEATIRRDFDQLADQRMLTRTRGGAISSGPATHELPLLYKTARHAPEKQLIGQVAAGLIAPDSTVALNGGTTTVEVARALANRAELRHNSSAPAVTVVTNALSIASELAARPQIKLVVTGGVARTESYELIGPLATYVLADLTFDLAILGVDGLDAAVGATAHHEGEASLNRLMAQRAQRVVIVADSSKIGKRAFARVCGPDEIDVVVTDAPASSPAATALTDKGIQVMTALLGPANTHARSLLTSSTKRSHPAAYASYMLTHARKHDYRRIHEHLSVTNRTEITHASVAGNAWEPTFGIHGMASRELVE